MKTEENSVLFALNELRSLEASRIETERRAKEAAERAEREARERALAEEKERAAHVQRVAEAEAKMRVEAETKARDAESERRVALLRAELEAVRDDRERLHMRTLAVEPPPASPSRAWLFAFVAAACVAGILGVVLVSRPPETVTIVREVPVQAAAPAIEPATTEAPPPAQVVATAPSEATPPPSTGRPHRPHPPRPPHAPTMDGLDFSHCAEDDPTCGI